MAICGNDVGKCGNYVKTCRSDVGTITASFSHALTRFAAEFWHYVLIFMNNIVYRHGGSMRLACLGTEHFNKLFMLLVNMYNVGRLCNYE